MGSIVYAVDVKPTISTDESSASTSLECGDVSALWYRPKRRQAAALQRDAQLRQVGRPRLWHSLWAVSFTWWT